MAEKAGFKDHRQMAEHMRSSGYVWDSEKENYVREEDREAKLPPPKEAHVEDLLEEDVEEALELEVLLATTGGDNGSFSVILAEMAQYLLLLRELQQKKDVLDSYWLGVRIGVRFPNTLFLGSLWCKVCCFWFNYSLDSKRKKRK